MNNIEKAIEHLETYWDSLIDTGLIDCETLCECSNALEKQLNGGWISVKEKLPEVCGLGILLTIENKFQQRKVIQGFTGYMERGKLEFHTNEKDTNLEVWKVIAWMPLPKPYKEVENEQTRNHQITGSY